MVSQIGMFHRATASGCGFEETSDRNGRGTQESRSATYEVENYNVSFRGATELELHIVADVSDERRVATLTSLRLR